MLLLAQSSLKYLFYDLSRLGKGERFSNQSGIAFLTVCFYLIIFWWLTKVEKSLNGLYSRGDFESTLLKQSWPKASLAEIHFFGFICNIY